MWRQVPSIVFTVLMSFTQYADSQSTCDPYAPEDCEFTRGVACGWDLQGDLRYEQNGTDWFITFDDFSPSTGNLTSRKACSTNGSAHCLTLRYLFEHNHISRLTVSIRENGGVEKHLLNVSDNMFDGVWDESQMTIRTFDNFTIIIALEKYFSTDLKLLFNSVRYTRSPCITDPSFSPSVSMPSTTSGSVSDNENSSSNTVVIAGIVVGIIVITGVTVAVVVVVIRRSRPQLVGNCCRKDKQQDSIPVRASRVLSANDAADNRQVHGENAEDESLPRPVDSVYDSGYEIPVSMSQLGTEGRNVGRNPGSADARTSHAAKATYENENDPGKSVKSAGHRYVNQLASSKTTGNRAYENQAFAAEASKSDPRDIHTQDEEYEIPDTAKGGFNAGTAHGTNGQNGEERRLEHSPTGAYMGLDFTKAEQERSVYTALYEGEVRSEGESAGRKNGQENSRLPSQRGNGEYAGLDFTNAAEGDNTYTGLQVAEKE